MDELLKIQIEENLKVGLLDILILKMISEDDKMYGYRIKQTINERSEGLIRLPEGSLYGPLYRMEKNGFIYPTKEFVGKTRFRVYYSITDLGKEFLKDAQDVVENIYKGAMMILKGGVGNDK